MSVSSTPGKTKHFQTIHLSERVILCDCPGLVFPNFATTKADLVCNGILPIDQMREHQGPVGLVTQRIPKSFLEAVYGIQIKLRATEEGGTGVPSSEELLKAYARARGFFTQGLGQPDESRAARFVLKDYVNGKLLWVHPPPGVENGNGFNSERYADPSLPERRRAAAVPPEDLPSVEEGGESSDLTSDLIALPAGPKSQKLDKGFFGSAVDQGHVSMPFNYKYTEQGRQLTGRKARTAVAMENGLDPKDVQVVSSKKHFKGNPKGGKGKRRMKGDDLN